MVNKYNCSDLFWSSFFGLFSRVWRHCN